MPYTVVRMSKVIKELCWGCVFFFFFLLKKLQLRNSPPEGNICYHLLLIFLKHSFTALPVRWEKRTWARWNTKRPNKPGWKRPTRGSFAWWRSRKLTWKRRKRCWKPTSLHWRKVQETWTVTTSWFHLRALRCKLPCPSSSPDLETSQKLVENEKKSIEELIRERDTLSKVRTCRGHHSQSPASVQPCLLHPLL